MNPNGILYHINLFLKGTSGTTDEIKASLQHSHTEKREKCIELFIDKLSLTLISGVYDKTEEIYQALCLINIVLGWDDARLFDAIKASLQTNIYALKVIQVPKEEPCFERIKDEAKTVWTLLNPEMMTRSSNKKPKDTTKCKQCKTNEVMVFPCGQLVCKPCFTTEVLCFVEQKRTRAIRCICNAHDIEVPTLISVLNMEKAEKLIDQLNQIGLKYHLVKCKACSGPACGEINNEAGSCLAQCGTCQSCFCTLCNGPYHGFIECSNQTENKNTEKENLDLALFNKSTMKGPETTQFEEEFYEGQANVEEMLAKIDGAFESKNLNPVNNPPWEKYFPTPAYYGEYQCLADGKWLEDVIIERAIKVIVQDTRNKKSTTVLESYIFSSFFNHSTKDFFSLLNEKGIASKEIIISLMNTDVKSVGGHWILGVANTRKRTIRIYDTSMVVSATFYRKFFYYILKCIYIGNHGQDVNECDWEMIVNLSTIQQKNSFDCGPLVIANVYASLFDKSIISSPDSKNLRKWIYNLVRQPIADSVVEALEQQMNNRNPDSISEFCPKNLTYSYKN